MFQRIIGLGQGGSRIASSFEDKFGIPACYMNLSHVDFSKFKPDGRKIVIETGGTGRDPDVGTKQALKKRNEIKSRLNMWLESLEGRDKDFLICIGGGGGSGCGLMKVVIPFLLSKKKNVFLIYTLPEKKEKLPAKPNSLKTLNFIIEEYLKTSLISILLVDNEYSANKYTSDDFRFAGTNKALPNAFDRFWKITNLHSKKNYLDFASGYNALDLNELKRVLYFSKGYSDIRIFSLEEEAIKMDDVELKKSIRTSSLFMGSFDINTTKIVLCSIAIPDRMKENKKINSFINRVLDIVGQTTKASYVFNSSYYNKNIKKISVNILLNGLVQSKALLSLINQAKKDIENMNKKGEIESLDLAGL